MWRPLYRGSFKNGTYEGVGHLFHIQWEPYKDRVDCASPGGSKAEGRTPSATFDKPPQTSNKIKYRGAFEGGEMTGYGTRYYDYTFADDLDLAAGVWLGGGSRAVRSGRHQGMFVQGTPHGPGTAMYPDATVHVSGCFKNGLASGKEIAVWKRDGETCLYKGAAAEGR